MKKIVLLALALLLAFTMISCTEEETVPVDTLQVGFGRESIHPTESVPLSGFGNTSTRFSKLTLDILKSTCVAFKSGDDLCLLYTNDLINSSKAWTTPIIEEISGKTGVPTERIFFTATHTHSAPDVTSTEPVMEGYREFLKTQMVKAAEEAIADLAPATLYGSKIETEGLNFIRHYTIADGTVAGDNFGSYSAGITGHAGENDPEMIVLKAEREGEKKDIILVNWQAHPKQTGTGAQLNISADYIAPFRENVEAFTDAHCAFFLGAAGNENPTSYKSGETRTSDFTIHGSLLAQYALSALENLEKIEGKGIEFESLTATEEYTQEKIDLYDKAVKVVDRWYSSGVKSKGEALAKKYGFVSVYEASAIKARAERIQRNELSGDITYYATRIGDFAFICAPYEMFAESGRFIKDNSPFKYTFVNSCATDSLNYFAVESAYEYNAYESFNSRFTKGIAERSADRFVELLKKLHE
ncbi:MAG: hypothetical protein IIV81_00905 [Clostridia bacterium]|nr:hypothetical protein [Clostridia bacterium]